MPRPANQQGGHLPGIHGLRAVAATGVMFMHVAMIPQPHLALPPVFDRIVPIGDIGVPLFFILSSYSLLFTHERSSNGRNWVRIYLIKRLFRIAPLFWFILLLYRILPFLRGPADASIILANVLFVFNFSSRTFMSLVAAGWTLGVEMPFYLCVPVIIRLVRTPLNAFILFVVTVVISLSYRHGLTLIYGATSAYPAMAFLSNLSVFTAGVLAYHLVKTWGTRVILWQAIGILGLAVMVALPMRLQIVPLYPSRPDVVVWTVALSAISAWQAVAPSYPLSLKSMQWLGERSYGIYLIHPLVIFLYVRYGIYAAVCRFLQPIGAWSYLPCVAITAAVVIPSAALAYLLIESPFQGYARMLVARLYGARKDVDGVIRPSVT